MSMRTLRPAAVPGTIAAPVSPAPAPAAAGAPEHAAAEDAARPVALAKALGAALRDAMAADERIVLLGEDVGRLGGVFRVTDGLQREFGEARVIDSPLSESGIVGAAIGLAMRGYRPVCEIQFDGFVYPAFDQIVTQLSRLRQRSGGALRMPVTIRIPYGGGIGAVEHHSESPEAYFAHTPGLRVLTPSTAADGYLLLRQAVACDDPVIFFEPKRRYWERGPLTPAEDPPLPMERARVTRPGSDVTLLAYGPTVRTCLDAAAAAAAEGRSVEVVDLRSLAPLDWPTMTASLRRTGRAVVVHEAPVVAGLGAEIAARLTEECFYHLEAPVGRVGGYHVPYPPARLEKEYLPDLDRVLDAVDRAFGH
ncbi:alpha-ketoacid dehydrogenase subunit beta [Frankia sp. CNm7]|uniref:Alpha-ketoacid dehydrogenase subunit beta n=1 Tax=Frankia nepalensis TaxID=1836974 RepID=A0A937UVZ2_9ACTN|nr:alpha-ketoacid dehydrogenase subunit beta [Frankia nepalensis]MBL7502148.1 alpha-ketoacid dehydrogenase subunit beta [Frankia nepalensis]MBL7514362.1 alpha-ketoacid dehydrogenase subunit beta [Frankia nepalensis]MBL7521308.1 alpha-ketoacid dehydrogenase subunit beta [Frankia nepalensis]MBL7633720.1 alpha-ketoacid dehydrogenase subunit beta [Frankia nepalensis]